jgi:dihydroxyacetone kinase phosphotransfer subunit
MIGIVVVSHSAALAKAALDLALQMIQGTRPKVALAAGGGTDPDGNDVLGTDATIVSDAIDEVASPDGVLVLMDLGSALMSAELALEFRSSDCEVVLTSAPFVEGLLAALVSAAGGATLAEVNAEAKSALKAKQSQLGDEQDEERSLSRPRSDRQPKGADAETPEPETPEPETPEPETPEAETPAAETPAAETPEHFTVKILNPAGLHARPAATLATTAGSFDATITFTKNDKTVKANSLMSIMTLGAAQGDTVTVAASGVQAHEALEKIREMFDSGFGELDD